VIVLAYEVIVLAYEGAVHSPRRERYAMNFAGGDDGQISGNKVQETLKLVRKYKKTSK
jgi:hypothetical protein